MGFSRTSVCFRKVSLDSSIKAYLEKRKTLGQEPAGAASGPDEEK